MALIVEVRVEEPSWRKAWPRVVADTKGLLKKISSWPGLGQPPRGIRPAAERIPLGGWPKPGHDETVEVSVVFADDAKLRELNSSFRGKDQPTNALSFPDDERPPGGGIALSFETISAEAKAQGKPFVNHAKHMILHGFLHLHGYDHEQPRAARLMEGLEIAMLAAMGIPNPYLIEKPRA
jgi:probable rRNA maturation factor